MHPGACTIFLWLPIRQPRLLWKLCGEASRLGCNVVLDLEDSLDTPGTSARERASARDRLAQFVSVYGPRIRTGLGLRINRLATDDFQADIDCLRHCTAHRWAFLFLPKLSAGPEYAAVADVLALNHVHVDSLVPIIETVAGLTNLGEILDAARGSTRYVQFGHFDYCYDAGIWPFWEMAGDDYWQSVAPLIRRVEAHGLSFINSACQQLRDASALPYVVDRLAGACALPFGQATLSLGQSWFVRTRSTAQHVLPPCPERRDAREMALYVVDSFRRHRESARSFVTDEDGTFIPPQAYRAALRYLGEREAVACAR